MSKNIQKPDMTDIEAASDRNTQRKCLEEETEPNLTFCVEANVNLAGVAEFVVGAANPAEAEIRAKQILDEAYFNITRDFNNELNFCVHVPEMCTECEFLEARQSSSVLPPDTSGLRSAVEAV